MQKCWFVALTACLLALFLCAAQAEALPARRALLVGCDDFVSHEDTAPSAESSAFRCKLRLSARDDVWCISCSEETEVISRVLFSRIGT